MTKRGVWPILLVLLVSAPGITVLADAVEDERRTTCGGNSSDYPARAAFELDRLRNFWDHFPNAGLAPELERDDPGYVVVFEADLPFGLWQAPNVRNEPWPSPSLAPEEAYVCVLVDGQPNVYIIDVEGFRP